MLTSNYKLRWSSSSSKSSCNFLKYYKSLCSLWVSYSSMMATGYIAIEMNLLPPCVPSPVRNTLASPLLLSIGWNSSTALIILYKGDNNFYIIAIFIYSYFYFSDSIFSNPANSSTITKSTNSFMFISNPLMNCLFERFSIFEMNLAIERYASFTVSSILATCLYWLCTSSKNSTCVFKSLNILLICRGLIS